MKQVYRRLRFSAQSKRLIEILDAIVREYMAQNLVLTVRQLYYQMVARNHIQNTERSYKRLTELVNNARIAGMIDWDGIEDRTREFLRRSRWTSPKEILRAVTEQYHEDLWVGQALRPFVIVEKEALAGVLQGVCHELDVPLLAARGYPSGTVLRDFSVRDVLSSDVEQGAMVIHLGDHDPSGIDMTRDLEERFSLFGIGHVELDRIALNMPQIQRLKPPENPAKTTDSRFESYRRAFGESSWELDALQPQYLVELVRNRVNACIDDKGAWTKRHKRIDKEKRKLRKVYTQWK